MEHTPRAGDRAGFDCPSQDFTYDGPLCRVQPEGTHLQRQALSQSLHSGQLQARSVALVPTRHTRKGADDSVRGPYSEPEEQGEEEQDGAAASRFPPLGPEAHRGSEVARRSLLKRFD